MEFFKTIIKNWKLIAKLAKNDFRNRFASTSLGSLWGFIQPFIFMFTYVIVFQYILKTGRTGNDPYLVWFLPAMSVWLTLNDSIMSATGSIRGYSYLVKKVVFPIDVIPLIPILSASFVGLFLILITTIVCIIFGYMPNILMLIYMLICMYAFIIAFTRFTSAVATVVPDFSQLLSVLMQLFFWFTPIVWNLSMLDGHPTLLKVFQSLPFAYLVTGFRQVFIDGNIVTEFGGKVTLIFWAVTIVMFLWGNYVFKKNKKDFADVL